MGVFRAEMEMLVTSRQDEEVDLGTVFRWLWQRRIVLSGSMFIGAVIGLVISFLVAEQFTAKVTLIPKNTSEKSSLLGRLASFSGLQGQDDDISEELYGHVIRSDRVLDKILLNKWSWGPESRIGTLAEFFDTNLSLMDSTVFFSSEANQLKEKLRRKVIRFDHDAMNGFMTVSVTLPHDPSLSAQLANFLVEELDSYNRDVHSAKAREQFLFIAERLAYVEGQLEKSEVSLMRFIQENRSYAESPFLSRKFGEIEREVLANRTVWIDLRSQLETAKIEEYRQMSSIRILDKATTPSRRSHPRRILYIFIGLACGLLFGLATSGAISFLPRKTDVND